MKFYHGMTCPVCEVGTLELESEDMEFEYKGVSTVLPHQKIFKCHECDESFLDQKDERRVEKLLSDERRRIDGLLTSKEIKIIRQQFGMTQAEFATKLRVVEKTFARYENGQATQSYAMDNLLRILWKYPVSIECINSSVEDRDFQSPYKKFSHVRSSIHYEIERGNVIFPDFLNKEIMFSSQLEKNTGEQESGQYTRKVA